MNTVEDRLLKAEEVAVRLGVSRNLVYEMGRTGKLRCVRIGRIMRFRASDLVEFCEAGGVPPEQDAVQRL